MRRRYSSSTKYNFDEDNDWSRLSKKKELKNFQDEYFSKLKLKSRCLIMIKIDEDNDDQRRNMDGQVLNYDEANQAHNQD